VKLTKMENLREANSISTAVTPHPCTTIGQHRCEGDGCGGTYSDDRYGGTCDPDGCDFNAYRQGVKDFYGPGMTVDTTKKFTVVTQFIKGSSGELSEIKRFYVQNGQVIANPDSAIEGNPGNSITPDFCKSQKVAFGDQDVFEQKGGFSQFSKGIATPMVLVMSLWDDHYANMLWLDSTYPTDASPDEPGKGRGTCDTSSGVPADIEASQASNQVIYCESLPFPRFLPASLW
jgi:cellulose 1,4-beta-cellobiosidase